MALDYNGKLVCIKCLNDRLREQLTDEYLDEVDKKLVHQNFYK